MARRTSEKSRLERALLLQERAKQREIVSMDFYVEFARYFREWLIDLAKRYKERNEFPPYPMSILPTYYTEKEDKEIAAFLALQMNPECEFDYIQEYREMIGLHPRKWFNERQFVQLSLGNIQNKKTGGVENWKISQYMNGIWERLCYNNDGTDIRCKSLEQFFMGKDYDVMVSIGDIANVKDQFRTRMLRLCLGASDGIGHGLWNIPTSALRCPLTVDMVRLLKDFIPIHFPAAYADKMIKWIGFEWDCDFFYACLGYKELQRRNPKGCSRMMTALKKWFDKGLHVKPYKWRDILIDIPF